MARLRSCHFERVVPTWKQELEECDAVWGNSRINVADLVRFADAEFGAHMGEGGLQYYRPVISEAFAVDDTDEVGFVQQVWPIVAGVLRLVEPSEVYVIKTDNWFGDKWLGFSNKLVGAVGVQYRRTLRVPPFVPARVRSQRFFRRNDNTYVLADAPQDLHIDQTSEDNAQRLMSVLCPKAAVFWWSGDTRRNLRGCVMAYLPTNEGHTGWYAELQERSASWVLSKTLCTTSQELAAYAADGAAAEATNAPAEADAELDVARDLMHERGWSPLQLAMYPPLTDFGTMIERRRLVARPGHGLDEFPVFGGFALSGDGVKAAIATA